ncbi:SET and MYND domain-containing protein 4-like [Plodia interpunctella]|uniref:SET and MYND domain-containing protein 4-like n=1 Tax=Plodia interpunctella TaxID=58824 RepID=UPI0023679B7B|nr:SET and MYND domain-containing protein 4-like [Plodia interpunctella]XP_053611151.1 SET and MYND domain-containing protein 4-like [Plodia interpunctella]XP_053611152.1 SET and MYND domain-containing protein 4-like [Plodia interpunctella]XP_053611153.1 SET and MYND domain-containing protein 4-like [Plodia interpunctella]
MSNYFEDHEELSQDVLDAMEGDQDSVDYFANVAMAALHVVNEAEFKEVGKNKSMSDSYREQGNRAYNSGYLQKSLILYNRALAYAPIGSLALKLAYGNRSAVLFSAELYRACEKDCSTALGIDCPTPRNIIEKVRRRKFQSLAEMRKGDRLAQHNAKIRRCADEYYKLKNSNSSVPCASDDIDIIIESGMPKVIAKRDIGPGTVVAVEKSFVSWAPSDYDQYFSCYYCRKLDLNLFPCIGCVAALFCSKECEETCLAEYHSIECQIIGNLLQIDNDERWLVTPMIKLRNLCASWEDFVDLSYDFGKDRMRKDTVNEIFDGNNPKSLLSFNNDRHFKHGTTFQKSYLCALFLKNLLRLKTYFPQDETGKSSAMKAFARIMMHLSVYGRTTPLILITDVNDSDSVGAHTNGHRGLFPFIGKLKHCCVPNLQKVTINNTMALLSVKSIKAGTELTVTHVFHWLENELTKNERKMNMYLECHMICSCFVCTASPKEWKKMNRQAKISDDLKKAVVKSLNVELSIVLGTPVKTCFEQMYKLMSDLQDVPFSDEYEVVYKRLGCLHAYVLNKKLNNMVLAEDM